MRELKISTAQVIVNKCNSLADFRHKVTENESYYVVNARTLYKGVNPSLDFDLLTKVTDALKTKSFDSISLRKDDKGIFIVEAAMHFKNLDFALVVAKAYDQNSVLSLASDTLLYLKPPIDDVSSERLVSKLLDRYFKIRNELLDFTQEYHDSMYWDAEGYAQAIAEDGVESINLGELEKSVNTHQRLLDAFYAVDKVEYTFS